MIVDWLLIINVFRVVLTLLILAYASYLDIKTRRISNTFWIVLALVAISILEAQLILEFGLDVFLHLLVLVPLMVLFMSFFACDWVVDFDKRSLNQPWCFMLALAAVAFMYLIAFSPPGNNEEVNIIPLIVPIVVYLSFFMAIHIILNYQFYISYNKHQLKRHRTKKIATKIVRPPDDQPDPEPSERFSWALFFSLLGFMIIILLMSGIITVEIVQTLGLFILVAIPIIIIFLYLNIQSDGPKKDSKTSAENDEDDQDYQPPNQLVVKALFFGLVFLGFVIIIHYSLNAITSNFIEQSFIIMIWLIIFYGFYNLGIIRGGADAKALMAMMIMFPLYPIIEYITIKNSFLLLLDDFPIIANLFPFAFTILINGAMILLVYMICLVVFNAARHDLKFPQAFLGYKLPIREVPRKFVWLMERVQHGTQKVILFPRDDIDLKKELKLLKKAGARKVWVTPKVPFIIPLMIGLVIAIFVGNILFLIIGL